MEQFQSHRAILWWLTGCNVTHYWETRVKQSKRTVGGGYILGRRDQPEWQRQVTNEAFSAGRVLLQNVALTEMRVSRPALPYLQSLRALVLQSNYLTNIDPAIFELGGLEELNLGHNRIRHVPPELGKLTNLRELLLHNNMVDALPDEIGCLSKLRVLDLTGNQLTWLPASILCLKEMKMFWLQGNPIDDLASNTHLATWILAGLPDCDGQFTHLLESIHPNDHPYPTRDGGPYTGTHSPSLPLIHRRSGMSARSFSTQRRRKRVIKPRTTITIPVQSLKSLLVQQMGRWEAFAAPIKEMQQLSLDDKMEEEEEQKLEHPLYGLPEHLRDLWRKAPPCAYCHLSLFQSSGIVLLGWRQFNRQLTLLRWLVCSRACTLSLLHDDDFEYTDPYEHQENTIHRRLEQLGRSRFMTRRKSVGHI